MISKILIYVSAIENIDDYRKAGVSAFLFGLDGYCVGYNTYSLDTIKKVNVSNKYILLNRVIDCKDIDKLKNVLTQLDGIKGIVFEDIGVYEVAKKMNLGLELILFQNHFATNKDSVSFWLERVDSVFLSNEITYEELKKIVDSVSKKVCVHLYGYNQVMYSRRLLLTNWSLEFNIPYKDKNIIEDKGTHIKFRVMENEYGTVMYSENIFNGVKYLKDLDVLYYYVNTMLIDHEKIMKFLNGLNDSLSEGEDIGFLEKETIYKLKER